MTHVTFIWYSESFLRKQS